MKEKPINENHVVDAVCRFLQRKGFEITQSRQTHQQGIDVVATRKRDGRTVLVEAKGDTSSRKTSSRYGKPFSSSQIKSHTGVALLKAAELLDQSGRSKSTVCIAVPKSGRQEKIFGRIGKSLKRLRITMLWVDPRTLRVSAVPGL